MAVGGRLTRPSDRPPTQGPAVGRPSAGCRQAVKERHGCGCACRARARRPAARAGRGGGAAARTRRRAGARALAAVRARTGAHVGSPASLAGLLAARAGA
jgi:hypothetical protein